MRTQTVGFMMVALSFTIGFSPIANAQESVIQPRSEPTERSSGPFNQIRKLANSRQDESASPPFRARDWTLKDHRGVEHSLRKFKGKPLIVIFYLGGECPGCEVQLSGFANKATEFQRAGLSLVAISAKDDTEDMFESCKSIYGSCPFLFLPNSKLDVFKAYDVYSNGPLHGTFLIDDKGVVQWRNIGTHAFNHPDAVLNWAKLLLEQPASDSAPAALLKRVSELELMNRRLQVRLHEFELRYEHDISKLAEEILGTTDVQPIPQVAGSMHHRVKQLELDLKEIARLDDTTKRFVPNLLGNMQQSESFLKEVRAATRGRLVLVNESGIEQLLYINGVKWRVRLRKSYAPIPIGPVTVQRPFGPTIQLTDPSVWKVDEQGHYLTFNLQTGRATRNGSGNNSLDGEYSNNGRNGSNGIGGAGSGHGRGHDDGTRDSRSHGHR